MVYDVIIRNGRVLDGTGAPWFWADVGIVGDTIRAIGRLAGQDAGRVLDAQGHFICPGFIDIHNHADGGLLVTPRADSLVQQGVTTALIGNCGMSPAPVRESTRELLHKYISAFLPVAQIDWRSLADLFDCFKRQGIGCNVASLVGHGSIRIAVMGMDARAPSERELDEMRALTAEAMAQGAFGLSSGLAYAPGMFASTDEVAALAEVVAEYGGIYASHIRSEGNAYLDSIAEAIGIGERAGVPVQISHMETHYPNFGRAREALALVDAARARGLDVTFDVPPYLMGMTTITSILPNWAQDGGIAAIIARLQEPDTRQRVKAHTDVFTNPAARLAGEGRWEKLWIVGSERHPEFNGRDLAELSRARGQEPYDAVFDLLAEESRQIMIVGEFHSEEDLRRALLHPCCMVESDEGVYAADSPTGVPHPRAYGTFPMIYRKYVRGETRADFSLEAGHPILTWEDAVRKMTSMPAARLGLKDRGLIREGLRADIAVLDPERIADRATYREPHQYPVGISWVLVNGVVVVEHGRHTGALPGRVLGQVQSE